VHQHPIRNWLSLRIRIACVLVFVAGTLIPPYVPKEALAQSDEELPDESAQFLLVEDGFLMKSSSLTQFGSRRAYAEGIIHVVQAGETVDSVAERYRIKPDTVRWANKLEANAGLKVGQQLIVLPVDGVLHTVTRGQTLTRIAELYEIPPAEIASQNGVQGGFILAGQELIIPGGKPIVAKPTVIAAQPVTPKPGVTPPKTAPPVPGRTPPKSPGQPTGVVATPTAGVLQMPCNSCSYTQYFNPGHYAVDIQQRGGGPIFASEAGTVIRADTGWNGGYGNVVEVDHGNGLVTLYAHNKELYVKVGDTVTRGQEITWMGNTGRVYGKTGIHVHYEVRVNGVKKNPILYLK
jgi:murein DD-endopeptidase MepM/ murein hydrolase activator NlpD